MTTIVVDGTTLPYYDPWSPMWDGIEPWWDIGWWAWCRDQWARAARVPWKRSKRRFGR